MTEKNLDILDRAVSLGKKARAIFESNTGYDNVRFESAEFEDTVKSLIKYEDFASYILFDTEEGRENLDRLFRMNFVRGKESGQDLLKIHDILCESYYSLYRLYDEDETFFYFEDVILNEKLKMKKIYFSDFFFKDSLVLFGRFLIKDGEGIPFSIISDIEEGFLDQIKSEVFYILRQANQGMLDREKIVYSLKNFAPDFFYGVSSTVVRIVADQAEEEIFSMVAEIENLYFDDRLDLQKFIAKYSYNLDKVCNALDNIFYFSLEDRGENFISARNLREYLKEGVKEGRFYSLDDFNYTLGLLINIYEFIDAKEFAEKVSNLKSLKGELINIKNLLSRDEVHYFDEQIVEKLRTLKMGSLKIAYEFSDFRDFFYENEVAVLNDKSGLYQKSLLGLADHLNLEPTNQVQTFKIRHFPELQIFYDLVLEKKFFVLHKMDVLYLEEDLRILIYDRMDEFEKGAFLITRFISYVKNQNARFRNTFEKFLDTILQKGVTDESNKKFGYYLLLMCKFGLLRPGEKLNSYDFILTDLGRFIFKKYFRSESRLIKISNN
ncbi:hypothetical protein HMPREF3189_00496 [Clostridiales bacterium KA00134]|nr:hypothetical protein HMPREF3189_00496 [Clostridiales bacterium KA00134]